VGLLLARNLSGRNEMRRSDEAARRLRNENAVQREEQLEQIRLGSGIHPRGGRMGVARATCHHGVARRGDTHVNGVRLDGRRGRCGRPSRKPGGPR
jgi:hypothetical protein